MNRVLLCTAGLGLALASLTPACAQECTAKVLLPVTDDMGHHWQAGQTLPVDIARGDTLCASGGSCVPAKLGGAQALHLLNCRIGAPLSGGDGDRKLVGDVRTGGPAFVTRLQSRDSVDERLSALGFSNAAAGSFADDYVNHPGSPNARLVRRALAGSARAIAALRAQMQ